MTESGGTHSVDDAVARIRRADDELSESLLACIELAKAKAELAGRRRTDGPDDTAMDVLKDSVRRYAIRERDASEPPDSVIARLNTVLSSVHRTGDHSFTLRAAAAGWCVQAYFEAPVSSEMLES